MCNRYRVTAKQIEIAKRYGALRKAQGDRDFLIFLEPETLPLLRRCSGQLFPKRMMALA